MKIKENLYILWLQVVNKFHNLFISENGNFIEKQLFPSSPLNFVFNWEHMRSSESVCPSR